MVERPGWFQELDGHFRHACREPMTAPGTLSGAISACALPICRRAEHTLVMIVRTTPEWLPPSAAIPLVVGLEPLVARVFGEV
jgi:hypothetical protein